MSAPVLHPCSGGRQICGPHRTATGQALYHTENCYRCMEIRANQIATGRPLKKDAATLTKRERMRRTYKDNLTNTATPEQLEAARVRGFASMGIARP
jgi:hypothetical protein